MQQSPPPKKPPRRVSTAGLSLPKIPPSCGLSTDLWGCTVNVVCGTPRTHKLCTRSSPWTPASAGSTLGLAAMLAAGLSAGSLHAGHGIAVHFIGTPTVISNTLHAHTSPCSPTLKSGASGFLRLACSKQRAVTRPGRKRPRHRAPCTTSGFSFDCFTCEHCYPRRAVLSGPHVHASSCTGSLQRNAYSWWCL